MSREVQEIIMESDAENSGDTGTLSSELQTPEEAEESSFLELFNDFIANEHPAFASLPSTVEQSSSAQQLLRDLWLDMMNFMPFPRRRRRLEQYNTINDVVNLIKQSKRVIVLTGAGVSVSCGIPDFRSKGGLYEILHSKFPELSDPQTIFDIKYFRYNPRPFFVFAKEIYPDLFSPSLTHRFIKYLELEGKLLRNYTQNIDTLESAAGIERVVYCHGSFTTASCITCKFKVDIEKIKPDILEGRIPICPQCGTQAKKSIMKPDVVFFGEDLPSAFHTNLTKDQLEADLLLVIGSSLKVGPVNAIPGMLRDDVPQVLINREPLPNYTFDVELLGNCDEIFNELALRLGEPYSACCKNRNFLRLLNLNCSAGGSKFEKESIEVVYENMGGCAGQSNVPSSSGLSVAMGKVETEQNAQSAQVYVDKWKCKSDSINAKNLPGKFLLFECYLLVVTTFFCFR
ncbi:NAD dependent deacetylase sirtuin 1 [Trichuris trichiura]|uniref:NAD dependent deacetylase sirtuin 1 n=1 Tax=Trichuris trichiura TaxID=36087 RepID=A0A077Z5J0_TRITR|nr:NAD dependent deacetylase sirtuin 1 [Trichuris trichiura]